MMVINYNNDMIRWSYWIEGEYLSMKEINAYQINIIS
jgi:hypothetical protein